MAEPPKPRVFLDSCSLIAGVMATNRDSAIRQLLRLGELGVIDLRISPEVCDDADYVVRKRRPESLPILAYLIDLSNIAVTLEPGGQTIANCLDMTGYLPDARVLAAAVECDADLFVTSDQQHFLQNPLVGPPNTRLRVVTAYKALEWIRDILESAE
jgi:predicted nucleic acid-binding protein